MNSVIRMVGATLMLVAVISMLPVLVKQVNTTMGALTGEPMATSTTTAPPPAPVSTTPLTPYSLSPTEGSQSTTDWTVLAIIGAVFAFLIIAVVVAFLLWRSVSRVRQARREERERRQGQLQRWAKGVKAVESVSEKSMAFESDPESVYFARPLLGDVNEPDSAQFYTAYSNAQALHTETVPADEEQITAFVHAATEALRAFETADENARRKARLGVVTGGRILTIDEKRKVGQARKLMAQALDSANPAEAAAAAHAKATELLDQVGVVVPERLVTAVVREIEVRHQPELAAAQRR